MGLLRVLAFRPFAFLWVGQFISRFGDSLYQITLAWWILEKTGSATAMGTVLIFSFTPMLLFLPIGGVAVDRLPRVKVMMLSDLIRGAIATVVSLLAFTHVLQIWHVYVASLIFGFIEAFFQPAYTATVPEITPSELLNSANTLTSLSVQIAGVAGPAISVFLVKLGGTPTIFALDALSFFVSFLCLILLSGSLKPDIIARTAPADVRKQINTECKSPWLWVKFQIKSFTSDVLEGINTVIKLPWLWITITIATLGNVTQSGPFSVGLPFLVEDNLHADVNTLGLLYSVSSFGSVIGAIWLSRLTKVHKRGLLTYCAWMLGGLMTIVIGLSFSIVSISLAVLIRGAMFAIFNLMWMNTLQELVPREMLGRVSSIDNLGSSILLPVGYGIAGWATDLFGASIVFVIGGVSTVGLAALGLFHPAIRYLD